MLSHTPYLSLLLLLLFPRTPTAASPSYTATDFILLNCGESSNLNDNSNRSWNGDANRSRYSPPNASRISLASKASHMHSSVISVPYLTARVFSSQFTYSFPVSTGHKFLRLYFYPDIYHGLDTSQSLFSVTANEFTLLSNFSAFLNSQSSNEDPSFMKEFVINVQGNQRIELTFTPNPSSFAFVNGVEIVSLPDKLYFRGVPIKFVDRLYDLKNDTALEKLYRLNVGGADVQIKDDSGPVRGMFRYWSQDDDYIFGADFGYTPHDEGRPIQYTSQTPPYSAPEIVYTTSRVMANHSMSLEWAFPVDSGFHYLLRFHFCEIQLEVTVQNQRVFTIKVDNRTAEIEVDVIAWTGGTGIPIFRDYIAYVPNDGRRGKRDLRLSLIPNLEGKPQYTSALLNGLEIFKLSDSNQSLAAANPEPKAVDSSPPAPSVKPSGKKKSSVIYAPIGSVIGVLAVVAAVSFLVFRRRQRVRLGHYKVIVGASSDRDRPYDENQWIRRVATV